MRQFMFAVLATLVFSSGAQAAPESPLGRWLTASGNLVIEIAPCGSALCGKVVEVRGNRSMEDIHKTIAVRAMPGMKIITDLVPYGDEWQGKIFNRENGKTYDCLIARDGRNLSVRPYIFISLIGQTQIWTRAITPPA
jgi:uncharacterized protein (DUF2147 family)